MQMVRFSWHGLSVKRRIHNLEDRDMRRRAKAAYEFLLNSDDTPYADFDVEHRAFLQQYPHADDIPRKRLLQFIEREGIECALWPQLFWKMDRCLTYIRATDPRRLARQNKKETVKRIVNVSLTDDEKDFEATAGAQDGTFHSIRRAYAALTMAPLMDYGSLYELLHFGYDLSLWTDLGSKASLGIGMPLRLMISREYWRSLHLGIDRHGATTRLPGHLLDNSAFGMVNATP